MGNAVIGALDISTVAYITDARGLLQNGPVRGDLIELDFVPGAVWEPGEFGTYSFLLPVLCKGADESARLANFRTIQALQDGATRTLTRTFTAGSAVSESCTCVVTLAEPAWDFGMADKFEVLLVIQVLTEWA